MEGKLFVLLAPSGTGKDTMIDLALPRCPDTVKCATYTTRAPREDEVDGVSQCFVTELEFRRMVDDGEFLEWVEYPPESGVFYGSHGEWINGKLADGKNVLLRIEMQGAFAIMNNVQATYVFIEPPNMEELERRLRGRRDLDESRIAARLKSAQWEIEQAQTAIKIDHFVVNDDLDRAVGELVSILGGNNAN